MRFNRQLQHLHTVLRVKAVMQSPRHDGAAVNVYYGCQVHKAVSHWDIADVDAPHLVGALYLQFAEQVWLAILQHAQFGQGFQRIDRHQPHQTHQSAHAVHANQYAEGHEMVAHAYDTCRRMVCHVLVYHLHDIKVFPVLTLWLVVVRAFADVKDLQLAVYADCVVRGN